MNLDESPIPRSWPENLPRLAETVSIEVGVPGQWNFPDQLHPPASNMCQAKGEKMNLVLPEGCNCQFPGQKPHAWANVFR